MDLASWLLFCVQGVRQAPFTYCNQMTRRKISTLSSFATLVLKVHCKIGFQFLINIGKIRQVLSRVRISGLWFFKEAGELNVFGKSCPYSPAESQ
jgi:hypothetical protein